MAVLRPSGSPGLAAVIYGDAGNGKVLNINKLLIDDRRRNLWRGRSSMAMSSKHFDSSWPGLSRPSRLAGHGDRDHRDSPLRGGPVMTRRKTPRSREKGIYDEQCHLWRGKASTRCPDLDAPPLTPPAPNRAAGSPPRTPWNDAPPLRDRRDYAIDRTVRAAAAPG